MNFGNEYGFSAPGSEGGANCIGSSRQRQCYEIQFKGHLDDHWADWFHGCSLTREEDGTTTMVAPMVDQAALFGLLNKVRDLSLPLISVMPFEPGGDDGP